MPPADLRLPDVVGIRHYARASARAQQRNRIGFDQEIAALKAVQALPDLQPMIDQGIPARDLLGIAETVARGRLASAFGGRAEAVRHFEQAAALQAKVPYMEPPFWYYPVQQSPGAALYQAGRFNAARDAFEAALTEAANNGWALYGLAETETRLDRPAHAQAARNALKRAWLGDPTGCGWSGFDLRLTARGQAFAAIHSSTTGAMRSRHLRPLKMP